MNGRRPAVVMSQKWRDLLFLHWRVEARAVQPTLPPGLEVDTYAGDAWLGIVPFRMRAIRPRFVPPVPHLSYFLEANVRTYVRDRLGRPGVWFYSLDCNRRLAVSVARRFFSLPYFFAALGFQRRLDEMIDYRVHRRGAATTSRFEYRGAGGAAPAAEGTLEHFLVERYRLFAWQQKHQRLLTGEVEHPPYQVEDVDLERQDGNLAALAGFAVTGPAAHALYSAGVDVAVRRVEPVAPRSPE